MLAAAVADLGDPRDASVAVDADAPADAAGFSIRDRLLNICHALGGRDRRSAAGAGSQGLSETGSTEAPYIPGDEVFECLKDLKKMLKADVAAGHRTSCDILGDWDILRIDLLPILCASDSFKIRMAVVELLVPMTWPIDEGAPNIPKQLLLISRYKEAFLISDALAVIPQMLLSLITIPRRSEHIVVKLHHVGIIDILTSMATQLDDREFSEWNMQILEIFSAIFRDRSAEDLKGRTLKPTLAEAIPRAAQISRHSRFGGSIKVQLDNGSTINLLNARQFIERGVGGALDAAKRDKAVMRSKKPEEISAIDDSLKPANVLSFVDSRGLMFIFKRIRMYNEGKLVVLDTMLRSDDEDLHDTGEHVLRNLFYEEWILESLQGLCRTYKNQGQSTDIDGEDPEAPKQQTIVEREFRFERIEMEFAYESVVSTYLEFLRFYKSLDIRFIHMITVMLHRISVKCKMEAYLFKVSTLLLFSEIIKDKPVLPNGPEVEELTKLMSDLGEIEVKPSLSWSDQVGVAVRILVENSQTDLVKWLANTLGAIAGLRSLKEDDEIEDAVLTDDAPESVLHASSNNNAFRMLLRLVKAIERDDNGGPWLVPVKVSPDYILSTCRILQQFLDQPFDGDGKPLHKLIKKCRVPKPRKKKNDEDVGDDAPRKRKMTSGAIQSALSKQFVDSDDDESVSGDTTFFEAERRLREKTAAEAGGGASVAIHKELALFKPVSVKATRPATVRPAASSDNESAGDPSDDDASESDDEDGGGASDEESSAGLPATAAATAAISAAGNKRARAAPGGRPTAKRSRTMLSRLAPTDDPDGGEEESDSGPTATRATRPGRVPRRAMTLFSDDEEDDSDAGGRGDGHISGGAAQGVDRAPAQAPPLRRVNVFADDDDDDDDSNYGKDGKAGRGQTEPRRGAEVAADAAAATPLAPALLPARSVNVFDDDDDDNN
ncbi:Topoisomerase 1-associated factor 1 [Cladochytrium tenue]|nr:Topoisomerase 1-associated factor 1 [Cladochytrium tenue]